MAITVEGKRYRVAEDMGFNHSVGMYTKVVRTDEGERVVVKRSGGLWRFWGAADRVAPVLAAARAKMDR